MILFFSRFYLALFANWFEMYRGLFKFSTINWYFPFYLLMELRDWKIISPVFIPHPAPSITFSPIFRHRSVIVSLTWANQTSDLLRVTAFILEKRKQQGWPCYRIKKYLRISVSFEKISIQLIWPFVIQQANK